MKSQGDDWDLTRHTSPPTRIRIAGRSISHTHVWVTHMPICVVCHVQASPHALSHAQLRECLAMSAESLQKDCPFA